MKKLFKGMTLVASLVITSVFLFMGMGVKAQAASSLASYDFVVQDVRGTDYNRRFDGDDGKYAVLVFGGVSSCFYTEQTLTALQAVSVYTDPSEVNLYLFDIKSNSVQDMKKFIENYRYKDRLCMASISSNSNHNSLFNTCSSSYGGSWSTMPLVVYKMPDGTIKKTTSGMQSEEDIRANLVAMGLTLEEAYDAMNISVNVQFKQTEARKMLQMINDFRTESGVWYWNEDDSTKTYPTLNKVKYDYELEKVAMLRAVELALSYSHTRPNNSSCFTAYSELGYPTMGSGENIAAGYTSAEDVFKAWREDDDDYAGQGHRRNMLSSQFKAVGFACVYFNGTYYWAQEFSSKVVSTSATTANNNTETRTVHVDPNALRMFGRNSNFTLTVGDTLNLNGVKIQMCMDDSFQGTAYVIENSVVWTVDDPSIVSCTNNKLKALKAGSTFVRTVCEGQKIAVMVRVTSGGNDKGGVYGNLEWSLDDAGKLYISGNGEMMTAEVENHFDYLYPWNNYWMSIKEIEIAEGVTSVGEMAFIECLCVQKLVLPDSLEIINQGAFQNCPFEVQNYKFPANLKYIGSYAFAGCDGLSGDLIIPDKVVAIGSGAFQSCTGLSGKAVIPEGVQQMGSDAFAGCKNLRTYLIGNENMSIGNNCIGYSTFYEGHGKMQGEFTIRGIANSTAQSYAQDYGCTFVVDPLVRDDPNPDNPFTDIRSDVGWQYSFAKYAYDKGLMTGKAQDAYGKVVFKPDDRLTRAELAQILYSLDGKPSVEYSPVFSDVKESDWFRKAVLWANENGVANGTGNAMFSPSNNITREQVATMLKKYAQMKGYDVSASADLSGFGDANSVSGWAKSNISWAVATGVMSGKNTGNGKILDPQGNATRAECAAMLKSFCERYSIN